MIHTAVIHATVIRTAVIHAGMSMVLRVLFLTWFQGHAALGARTGLVLHHFRVHGTGVFDRCPLVHRLVFMRVVLVTMCFVVVTMRFVLVVM